MKQILSIAALVLTCWASAPQAQVTRYVYLSPIDGDGSDATPFISRCVGEKVRGAGNIDLRPWGINRFLCASDDLPANTTGLVRLGDALAERMTDQRKAALEALLGKPLTETGVREIIREVLLPKLRAGRDGKIKIWLGEKEPLVQQTAWMPFNDHGYAADLWNALQPTVAWATTLATETFTCADNASLTCVQTWTEFNGTTWAIASNVAAFSGATTNEARIDSDLATDDHEVQATMTAANAVTETRCGVIGRKDSTTTRTYYSFQAIVDGTPANSTWRLMKRVTGTATTLATDATDPAVNDVMKLRDDGSSHSGYVNGTQLISPVTDSDITGNTRVGIVGIGANASDSCSLDNVIAYDYPLPASSSGAVRRRAF